MNATGPTRSSSLIVDFPSTSNKRDLSEMRSATKTVRFAQKSQGRYINYPTRRENEAKWYSKADYDCFQHVMFRDVVKSSIMLAAFNTTAPRDEKTSEKHIIRCVGLDHLISRDVKERYHAIKEARKKHARVVLREQKWQMRNNIESPMNLARVSSEDSRAARERSYKVAVLSASVL